MAFMKAGYKVQVEVWGTGVNAEAFALIRSLDFFFSFKIDVLSGEVTVNDFNIYNIGLVNNHVLKIVLIGRFFNALRSIATDKSTLKLMDWLRLIGHSKLSPS